MIRSTSIEAYLQIKMEGIPDTQQEQILMLFRFNKEPMTNREMADALGLEPSTVSARRNELLDKGLMRLAGKRRCHVSGFKALTWEVV